MLYILLLPLSNCSLIPLLVVCVLLQQYRVRCVVYFSQPHSKEKRSRRSVLYPFLLLCVVRESPRYFAVTAVGAHPTYAGGELLVMVWFAIFVWWRVRVCVVSNSSPIHFFGDLGQENTAAAAACCGSTSVSSIRVHFPAFYY